jgi:adenosine deaminase CECR1
MTDEYYTAVTEFNLSWEEIIRLGINSLEHAFVQPEIKAKLLAEYQADIERFEQQYSTDNWQERLNKVQPISSGYSLQKFGIKF